MDLVHERGGGGFGPPLVVDLLNRHPDSGEINGSKSVNGRNNGSASSNKTSGDDNGGRDEDATDAWPQAFRRRNSPVPGGGAMGGPVAAMPVARDSEVYNMNHRRRGVAFIFNHMHFHERLELKQRNGTNADRDNLRLTLRSMDFEVRVYNDLVFKDLERLLEDCATSEDHSDADCVLVAVLSHGEMGILYSYDHAYKPDRLWSHFDAEKCPTLAGE